MKEDRSDQEIERLIEASLRTFPHNDPPDSLWPRITDDLRRSSGAAEAGNTRRMARPVRRPVFLPLRWVLYPVAALLIVAGGIAAWDFVRTEPPTPSASERADATRLYEAASDDLDHAMEYYENAIAKLTALARQNEQSLDPEYAALQKERISHLRQAVDECKASFLRNRYNEEVRGYLITAYTGLQKALEEMAAQEGV